jgi:hypothetical protein
MKKKRPNMDRIAKALGAQRKGRVTSKGGYFGALELLAEIEDRFKIPANGGRATDPRWTERRLVPLAPRTLERLERLAAAVRRNGGKLEPMQVAALLLERTTEDLGRAERILGA